MNAIALTTPPAEPQEWGSPVGNPAGNPLDLPTETFRSALTRRAANRQALMDWIRQALLEGTDYARLHITGKTRCPLAAQGRAKECMDAAHWSKPVLLKPGAEKVCGMLGVTVQYPGLADYEQAAYSGVDIRHIVLRCELADAQGRIVAVGVGARTLAQDSGDLNKALKMAEKSAHVDATLRLGGLSEVFTQDLEDLRGEANEPHEKAQTPPPAGGTPAPQGQGASPAAQGTRLSAAQCHHLEARIQALGLDRERITDWIRRASRGRVEHLQDMTPAMGEVLDGKLEQWTEAPVGQAEASGPRGRAPEDPDDDIP